MTNKYGLSPSDHLDQLKLEGKIEAALQYLLMTGKYATFHKKVDSMGSYVQGYIDAIKEFKIDKRTT